MDMHLAMIIGREFVRQYYTLLHKLPRELYRFYSPESHFIRADLEGNGACLFAHSQNGIRDGINKMNYNNTKVKIRQIDSQPTLADGVLIQVCGELSTNNKPMRRFMQSFVLSSVGPKSYYIVNDIFRYQEDVFPSNESDEVDSQNSFKINEYVALVSTLSRPSSELNGQDFKPEDVCEGCYGDVTGTSDPPTNDSFRPSQDDIAGLLLAANGGTHGLIYPPDGFVAGNETAHLPIIKPPMVDDVSVISADIGEESKERFGIGSVPRSLSTSTSSLAASSSITLAPEVLSVRIPDACDACDKEAEAAGKSGGHEENLLLSEDSSPAETSPAETDFKEIGPPQNISPEVATEVKVEGERRLDVQESSLKEAQGPVAEEEEAAKPMSYALRVKTGSSCQVQTRGRLPSPGFGRVKSDMNARISPVQNQSLPVIVPDTSCNEVTPIDSSDKIGNTSQDLKLSDSPSPPAGAFTPVPVILNPEKSRSIFVGNIPRECQESELRNLFERFGKIAELKIVNKNPQANVPAISFIHFVDWQGVERCLQARPLFLPMPHGLDRRLNVEVKYHNENSSNRQRPYNGVSGVSRNGGYDGRSSDSNRQNSSRDGRSASQDTKSRAINKL